MLAGEHTMDFMDKKLEDIIVTLPFEDVTEDMWSYKSIKNMYLAGFVNGVAALYGSAFPLSDPGRKPRPCFFQIGTKTIPDIQNSVWDLLLPDPSGDGHPEDSGDALV